MKIIFVIIVIIFIYYQYNFINKTHDVIEIMQSNNPEKDQFESIVAEKKPAVFTNILNGVNLTKRNIREYFHYYLPSLCLNYNYELLQETAGQETHIVKQTYYRYILYQISGTKNLILFSPKETQYLYPDISKTKSNVNYWKQNDTIYPKFNNVSYLEIILRPSQMLDIPPGWWYTTTNDPKSSSLICVAETIFSKVLKKNT
jgi:hypothetical protein